MRPRVINLRREHMSDRAVLVARPSRWGNPYKIGRDGDREAVIRLYRHWIEGFPELLRQLSELRDRDLACWCAPEPCHADVLLELANQ